MFKLTIAALIAALNINSSAALYPETMIITEVNQDKNLVTAETATGFIYSFSGTEDYQVNDLISCIMNDNVTEDNITDDIIVSVQYSGFYTEEFRK